jgi:hypothetical protein
LAVVVTATDTSRAPEGGAFTRGGASCAVGFQRETLTGVQVVTSGVTGAARAAGTRLAIGIRAADIAGACFRDTLIESGASRADRFEREASSVHEVVLRSVARSAEPARTGKAVVVGAANTTHARTRVALSSVGTTVAVELQSEALAAVEVVAGVA